MLVDLKEYIVIDEERDLYGGVDRKELIKQITSVCLLLEKSLLVNREDPSAKCLIQNIKIEIQDLSDYISSCESEPISFIISYIDSTVLFKIIFNFEF